MSMSAEYAKAEADAINAFIRWLSFRTPPGYALMKQTDIDRLQNECEALRIERDAARAAAERRVDQLVAALRPFAGIADEADALGHLPGSTAMWRLAYNDLAPARAALKGEK